MGEYPLKVAKNRYKYFRVSFYSGFDNMPNLVPLRYMVPFGGPYTEEMLLNVFHDLKGSYSEIKEDFKISRPDGMGVENFSQLLFIATSKEPNVILEGTGCVGGLKVENGAMEYDLSEIRNITKDWDINRSGTCLGCGNSYYKNIKDEMKRVCDVVKPMDWSGECNEYNPIARNSRGEPARKLSELIGEVSKEVL